MPNLGIDSRILNDSISPHRQKQAPVFDNNDVHWDFPKDSQDGIIIIVTPPLFTGAVLSVHVPHIVFFVCLFVFH